MTGATRPVAERVGWPAMGLARAGPLTDTEVWLYVIGLVVGFIHLCDVVSASAESAIQFVPALLLWLAMVFIRIVDPRLGQRWTPEMLIAVSIAWIQGGVMRHLWPMLTKGVSPAAMTGTFSTIVGVMYVVLALLAIHRRGGWLVPRHFHY
ncbi:MAG TPA: hypothetical protein VFJ85_20030 [Acidimicrobiales bacterium]|nr:hypothetical protein [Acidimicrobiales bacterium]